MSTLSDLLRQVHGVNPGLAADLRAEVKALSSRRPFGLNFKRHASPEVVELPGVPYELVTPCGSSRLAMRPRRVIRPSAGWPESRPRASASRTSSRSWRERRFQRMSRSVRISWSSRSSRTPSTRDSWETGRVRRGAETSPSTRSSTPRTSTPSKPCSSPTAARSMHLHRPAVQHRREGLEVQQRLRRGRRPLSPLQVAGVHGAAAAAREGAAEPGRVSSHRHD